MEDECPPSLQEEQLSAAMVELRELKTAVADTEPVGPLLACARTLDQVRGEGWRREGVRHEGVQM